MLTSTTLFGLDLPANVALAIYLSIVVLVNAIVDVIVALLDPRTRGSPKRA